MKSRAYSEPKSVRLNDVYGGVDLEVIIRSNEHDYIFTRDAQGEYRLLERIVDESTSSEKEDAYKQLDEF